jgi:acetone carboxylase alpha subunit
VEDVIAPTASTPTMKFSYEVIEEGRRGLMSRIKAMTMPGKYRKVSFVDVPYKHEDVQVSNAFAKLDSIMHSPCEMTIKKPTASGGSTSKARAAGAGIPSTPTRSPSPAASG